MAAKHKIRYDERSRSWACICGESFSGIGDAVVHLPIRKVYRKSKPREQKRYPDAAQRADIRKAIEEAKQKRLA